MPTSRPYCGFGLDFQSDIAIPEMRAGNAGLGEPVEIRLGHAPCPASLVDEGAGFAAGPDEFWMDVPGIARLHVHAGVRVAVEPADHAAMDDVRAFLLGSAMGAVLHQRGRLPLHASAAEIEGVAVAFTGPSGAGKSSLALALVKRGHRLLCDDIAAIDLSGNEPCLWPGLLNLKLWADSIAAADEQPDGLRTVLGSMHKYLRPVELLAPHRGHRLGHIVRLAVTEDAPIAMKPVHGSDAAAVLVANTFRGQLIAPMAQGRAHFERCIQIAHVSRVWTLSRPWTHDAMATTCAMVEAAVRTS